jgi:protein SCO1/2
VTAASLRGRPVVFAFVYSTCKDICPAQVQTIRGALDDLGHDMRVVGVSVDPANDTPSRAPATTHRRRPASTARSGPTARVCPTSR